jgi:hypothetical protein
MHDIRNPTLMRNPPLEPEEAGAELGNPPLEPEEAGAELGNPPLEPEEIEAEATSSRSPERPRKRRSARNESA